MKILVVCQHYWPEPYPLTDFCEGLVEKGHQVDVLTDVPNYPMGYIYDGYKKCKRRKETHNGVNIIRIFTIPRRKNSISRVLNYYSYSLSSMNYVKHLPNDYDVVFMNQSSPIMMVRAGLKYAKKHNKKAVMYCMDLWPASLSAGGLSKDSFVYKLYKRVSGKIYNKADKILITSSMFSDYLHNELGVPSEKISYLPQYAIGNFEVFEGTKKDDSNINLMFAGNIGTAQSIDTIIGAAQELIYIENLKWHIIGDGSELNHLKELAKDLPNVIFHGRKPLEEMPKFYAMADAMLITLTKNPLISMTLPGKMQTYMAAGKPIIGAATGEIPVVIKNSQCGYCAEAEDAKELAKAVVQFIENNHKAQLGTNAKTYYNEHFTREQFLNDLEKQLNIN